MKKKIKDLTLREIAKKCSQNDCKNCPFSWVVDCTIEDWLMKHIDLEKEVEVDE